ncbi:hypothetical protein AB205_0211760, partial [Aquarana catesbeiana]
MAAASAARGPIKNPAASLEDFPPLPSHADKINPPTVSNPLDGIFPASPTDSLGCSPMEADLQQLGIRIEAIESKTDQIAAVANQNTDRIQELHDQLDMAYSKLDDLENRSRRYNFRLRGLPESFKDTDKIVRSFIKHLLPDNPDYRLELDRAHRALQPPRQDGLPRDIVVKPHFFRVKEEVMHRARETENLSFQGHPIQIFADLSPLTIQKRRSLKPLLSCLSQKSIAYR